MTKKLLSLLALGLMALGAQAADATYETVTLPYADLTSSMGKFQIENVTVPTEMANKAIWAWKSSTKGNWAQASAYVNKTNLEAESYLVSPIIDLTKAGQPKLVFSHTGKYFADNNDKAAQAKLCVRTEGGEWQEQTIDNWFAGNDWVFVADTLDLTAFKGKKVQIGFRYISTTAGSPTWEIQNLTVQDYAPNQVPVITFSPEGGTFDAVQTVTLTCNVPEAEIYYTLDGSEPNDETAQYDAPLTISKTTTLKAVGYVNGEPGEIATQVYTINLAGEALPYTDLTSSLGKFTIEDVNNTTGKQIWKWDSKYGAKATAYISGTRYAVESMLISPLIDLRKAGQPTLTFSHAGKFFATPISSQAKVKVREEGGEWQELTVDKWFANTNWTFVDATIDLSAYKGKQVQIAFDYNSNTTDAGTWEVKTLKVEDLQIPADTLKIATLAEANALDDATEFQFTGNAVVTYQNGSRLFVKDASGAGLIYGKQDATFEQGTVLKSGWMATKTTYSGTKEFTGVTPEASGETQAVAPVELAEDQVTADLQNTYAILKGVTISLEKASAVAKRATSTKDFTIGTGLAGYNQFGADVPDAPEGKTYDVIGIVAVHNGNVQIMPISITEATATGVADVNAAKAVSSISYYNLAGQQSAQPFEGVNVVKTTYTDGTTTVSKVVK